MNLTIAALEIARDANPRLNFQHTLEWILNRGDELRGPTARAKSDRAILKEIARCLSGQHGLHGDRGAFHVAESSYVNRVIETGVGIPISLSIIYMRGERQAWNSMVLAVPLHFLTRYESVEGPRP